VDRHRPVGNTHRAPVRGDYLTGVVSCCGRRLPDLPAGDALVVDTDTPTCGHDRPNPEEAS
jgi:hypothetical protein